MLVEGGGTCMCWLWLVGECVAAWRKAWGGGCTISINQQRSQRQRLLPLLLLLLQVLQGAHDVRVQHRALQLLTGLVHGNKALRQQALQVRRWQQ